MACPVSTHPEGRAEAQAARLERTPEMPYSEGLPMCPVMKDRFTSAALAWSSSVTDPCGRFTRLDMTWLAEMEACYGAFVPRRALHRRREDCSRCPQLVSRGNATVHR